MPSSDIPPRTLANDIMEFIVEWMEQRNAPCIPENRLFMAQAVGIVCKKLAKLEEELSKQEQISGHFTVDVNAN